MTEKQGPMFLDAASFVWFTVGIVILFLAVASSQNCGGVTVIVNDQRYHIVITGSKGR